MRGNGEKYKILTEIIPDIVYEFDREGRFSFISDAVREMGYNPEELIGRPFKDIVHPDDFRSLDRLQISEEGMTKCFEIKIVLKDPSHTLTGYRYAEVHFCAKWENAPGEDKNYTGSIGVIKDITKYKQAEEALEESRSDLKETYEELIQSERLSVAGQLASGIAHEVRNLLGILIQDINYLESKTRSKKSSSEIFDMMKANVQRANKIIESLVNFSKASKLKIQPEDINSVIKDSLKLVQYKPKRGKIKFVKNLEKGLPKVLIDRGKMEQVFINVFLNAIQAMSGKGMLAVKTKAIKLERQKDKVGKMAKDYFMLGKKAVIVEIEDTGCGIPPESLGKIFEPFFTTKELGKGTGLGLSVTKKIMEMQNALINVESEVNRGTRIILTLRTEEELSRPRTKIMIVDDETDFLKIAKLNLEETCGYQILALSNAKDIVREVNNFKPDVILLDLLMPAIGGLDACELLSNDPIGKGIPIVILSAVDKDMEKVKAYKAGVKDYLVKPIELDTLIEKIENVLTFSKHSSAQKK
ncbi:MAG: response regulator [Candidatus Omnitrophota bacterium]